MKKTLLLIVATAALVGCSVPKFSSPRKSRAVTDEDMSIYRSIAKEIKSNAGDHPLLGSYEPIGSKRR